MPETTDREGAVLAVQIDNWLIDMAPHCDPPSSAVSLLRRARDLLALVGAVPGTPAATATDRAERYRLAWLSAVRGRRVARMDRDEIAESLEPYGECWDNCDCGDHKGPRSCGCHITGEEARAYIRQQEDEIEHLKHQIAALSPAPGNEPQPDGAAPSATDEVDSDGYFDVDDRHHCPLGHLTTYQAFSGGREWFCPTCHDGEGGCDNGIYPDAPANVGPRARLLTQPGGADELKRQMDEHFAAERAASVAQEGGDRG